jgi:hypothetical protein
MLVRINDLRPVFSRIELSAGLEQPRAAVQASEV